MAVIVKGISSSGGGAKIAAILNDDGTQSLIISDKDTVIDLTPIDEEIRRQDDLIAQIQTTLRSKSSGGGNELTVIAPVGSTVTATKDGLIKTATENNGTWTLKGLDAGDWTVTASLGEKSASKIVTIVANELEISYTATVTISGYQWVNARIKHNGVEYASDTTFTAELGSTLEIEDLGGTMYGCIIEVDGVQVASGLGITYNYPIMSNIEISTMNEGSMDYYVYIWTN